MLFQKNEFSIDFIISLINLIATDKTFSCDDDYLTEYSENVKVIQLCTCNFIRATGIIDFQPCLSHRLRRIENDNSEGTILSTDIKIRVFYRDCHG